VVPIQPSASLRLDNESFVRCDNIATLDQQDFESLRGSVAPDEMLDIATALTIAFDL
jgi:mRNA-degrading endonuclease toxin of MazEF toxin-antitoxin module